MNNAIFLFSLNFIFLFTSCNFSNLNNLTDVEIKYNSKPVLQLENTSDIINISINDGDIYHNPIDISWNYKPQLDPSNDDQSITIKYEIFSELECNGKKLSYTDSFRLSEDGDYNLTVYVINFSVDRYLKKSINFTIDKNTIIYPQIIGMIDNISYSGKIFFYFKNKFDFQTYSISITKNNLDFDNLSYWGFNSCFDSPGKYYYTLNVKNKYSGISKDIFTTFDILDYELITKYVPKIFYKVDPSYIYNISNVVAIKRAQTGDHYVSDGSEFFLFAPNGSFIKTLSLNHNLEYSVQISDFEINTSGNIIILDKNKDKFFIFSKDGEYISETGSYGSDDGLFSSLVEDISLDSDDNIYVADMMNHRVQKFDKDGNFISIIGFYGNIDGYLISPETIRIDINNNLYVYDSVSFWSSSNPEYKKIEKYNSQGYNSDTLLNKGEKNSLIYNVKDYYVNNEGLIFVYDSSYYDENYDSLLSKRVLKTYDRSGYLIDLKKIEYNGYNIHNFFISDENNYYVNYFDTVNKISIIDSSFHSVLDFDDPQYNPGILDGYIMEDIYDAALNSKNELYVFQKNIVDLFDNSGNFIRCYKDFYDLSVDLSNYKIALDSKDNIYLFDRYRRADGAILKYDQSFNLTGRIFPVNEYAVPYDLFVDDKNNLYLLFNNNYIEIYDENSNFVKSVSFTIDESDYSNYIGISVDIENNIYLLETENYISIIDQTGNFIRRFEIISSGNIEIITIFSINISPDGDVVVSAEARKNYGEFHNDYYGALLFFNKNGELKKIISGTEEIPFILPDKVIFDNDKNIYICDSYYKTIYRIKEKL